MFSVPGVAVGSGDVLLCSTESQRLAPGAPRGTDRKGLARSALCMWLYLVAATAHCDPRTQSGSHLGLQPQCLFTLSGNLASAPSQLWKVKPADEDEEETGVEFGASHTDQVLKL